ncbi:hexose transporter Ght6 [Schizosaccharomyces japonicus yFS275]|uniref:Hexose transporter Ght6 n=1 Tax=Schizosaccharomyces japonicus (strain yFS275 / FY16936) TaxID=402676 RepID=B6K829_SCHJY|nr:hexose transporter Ght6 [Schizosaccharomyces japonicus yFS275]EEB09683.1 hexose transporter Ght6 [Schizosaccharomyces japonicus yFS275]
MARVLPIVMLTFVSMAGWMLGADTGAIGGLTNMRDFQERFADKYNATTDTYSYSSVRQGLLVGMVNTGTFVGSLLSSPLADQWGKRICILIWSVVYLSGILVQLTTQRSWVQFMCGKIWTGLGFGALSVIAPSYQSETSPANIRGAIVCTYQLFITLGILVGYAINIGTHSIKGSNSWRIPIGINLLWGVVCFAGTLCLPESPRYLISLGKKEECLRVLCNTSGLPPEDSMIQKEFKELDETVTAELQEGQAGWSELLSSEIRYRTLLGVCVMALQQLTGVNYYFYYGTEVFKGTGISSPYVAAIILGAVNSACTFLGVVVLEKFGRRNPLILGAAWQAACYFVYAAVGDRALYRKDGTSNHNAGTVMIIFSCLFILSFASTWAPAAWIIVGESYPIRYRNKCSAVATSANWTLNFLISFFTPFITASIGFKYGYVFASCNVAAAFVIFFFAKETKGLTLEEINTLYTSGVKPWNSVAYAKSVVEKRMQEDNALQNSIQVSTISNDSKLV